MNVQTKRWARPLALFIALTMVMMYSFGGVVFAKTDDKVHVHYKGSKGDTIVVTTLIDDSEYKTNEMGTKNGNLFKGEFKESPPDGFKGKLEISNTKVVLNGLEILTIKNISADGNGVINIIIDGSEFVFEKDLAITKTVDNAEININDSVTFTIVVTNIGDDDIKNIKVTDAWPEGLSLSGIDTAEGTKFKDYKWDIKDLDSGKSVQLKLTAIGTTIGSFTNIVSLDNDDNNSNNQSSATVKVNSNEVIPSYDLKIEKVSDISNVTKGSIVTFTITAKNVGNTTITGVTVADIWTDGLTDLTVVSLQGNSFTTSSSTGTWDIGDIGPNGSDTKTLKISAKASEVGTATNTAIGYLNETDSTPTNEASAVVQIINTVIPTEKTYDLPKFHVHFLLA